MDCLKSHLNTQIPWLLAGPFLPENSSAVLCLQMIYLPPMDSLADRRFINHMWNLFLKEDLFAKRGLSSRHMISEAPVESLADRGFIRRLWIFLPDSD